MNSYDDLTREDPKKFSDADIESVQDGICAVYEYPKNAQEITLETVCELKKNLLLSNFSSLIDYISKQLDAEIAKNDKESKGRTIVGNEKKEYRLYEYELLSIYLLITEKNKYYYTLEYLCKDLDYYANRNIFNVLQSMDFNFNLNSNNILEINSNNNNYFESQAILVAKKSKEVKTLKEVWFQMALTDFSMCDMIRYLIIPIFIERRIAELHSLRRLYSDYKQMILEYNNIIRIYEQDEY